MWVLGFFLSAGGFHDKFFMQAAALLFSRAEALLNVVRTAAIAVIARGDTPPPPAPAVLLPSKTKVSSHGSIVVV